MKKMKFYKKNAIAAGLLFLVSAFLGMYFGMNFDLRFPAEYNDQYMISHGDAMMRAAHTHGMPFALYNLLLAFVIPYMGLSDKMKGLMSWSGILMILMPIALFLRGITYPSTTFDSTGFIGAFFFVLVSVLLVIGSVTPKTSNE
jgi:hypothetical protein